MSPFHINYSIDIGTIVVIFTVIAGIIGSYYALRSAIQIFSARFEDFKESVEKNLDRHEDALREVSAEVQKMIGALKSRDRYVS